MMRLLRIDDILYKDRAKADEKYTKKLFKGGGTKRDRLERQDNKGRLGGPPARKSPNPSPGIGEVREMVRCNRQEIRLRRLRKSFLPKPCSEE